MNIIKKQMNLVIVMLFISSFSLLLSFFGDYNGNVFNIIMAYAVGVLFWGFLIAAYVLLAVVNSKRKKLDKDNKEDSQNYRDEHAKRYTNAHKKGNKPGIITFGSSRLAIVFDIVMIIALILTIVFSFIPPLGSIAVVCFSVLVFAIHMHCILNGVNFRYIYNSKGEQ